jgi:hypothetical protein
MSKQMVIETSDIVKLRLYTGAVTLFYLLYFLVFFGIYYINPDYVHLLSLTIQLCICLFLLWSFNPFIKQELRIYDGQIIFAAAFFLLNNVVITEIESYFHISIQKYIDSVKSNLLLTRN